MDNKTNNKQNKSMFLYTALIFVVALLLIILAFFGQTNLTNLRKTAEEVASSETEMPDLIMETQSPMPTEKSLINEQDELAKLSNTISTLDAENKNLKSKIEMYDNLIAAYNYITVGNKAEAQKLIDSIEENKLTDDQKILYNNIIKTINEGKEQ